MVHYLLVFCALPPRIRYLVVSQSFASKTDKVEPWYKVDYSMRKIDAKLIDKWSKLSPVDSLHLPSRNEFIPTNFDLVQPPENAPAVPVIIKVSYAKTCIMQSAMVLVYRLRGLSI